MAVPEALQESHPAVREAEVAPSQAAPVESVSEKKPRREPMPATTLQHFDVMRGVAAFAVLLGHVRGLYLVEYDPKLHGGVLVRVLYLLTGLGHQAVVVFFVLSGLFIGTSVLESSADRRWSWRSYLLNRFTRLQVVLLPALVATAIIDHVGMSKFGAVGNVYAGKIASATLQLSNVPQTTSPRLFLVNALFLQDFFGDPFGSNSPLWSLSIEFWLYILFPLAVRALARDERVVLRVLYAATCIGLFYVGGERMVFYGGIWGLGALVAFSWRNVRRTTSGLGLRTRYVLAFATGGAASLALFVARARFVSQDVGDVLLSSTMALFVLALFSLGGAADGSSRRAYGRIAALIAGFSYTLYLVHYPPVLFLRAWWPGGIERFTPGLFSWGVCVGLSIVVAWLWAYPFSRLTEAHTSKVRRFLGSRLGISVRA